ncbi:MAG: SDR family oxidoreductase [Dehalococcoidales bacterium]|nr:SDR family oxidoreductase [Dehalococcoidales bacterium]
MDLDLSGKVALVTGAGSQVGFGKASCLLLAREGCDIIAADIDLAGARETAAEVEKLGRRAMAVKCDITRKAEVIEMVEQAIKQFGRIDILLNNAGGIAGKNAPFETQDEAEWDKDYNLNLKGPMLVTQSVYPHMAERKYGKIINISSDTAKMAFPGVQMYSIAKSALYVFSRGLAKMAAPNNINVNVISPGWSMDTDFMKGTREMKEKTAQAFSKDTPMNKGTSVMDIASAVAYLASDLSGDITGQVLSISGGSTMQ